MVSLDLHFSFYSIEQHQTGKDKNVKCGALLHIKGT